MLFTLPTLLLKSELLTSSIVKKQCILQSPGPDVWSLEKLLDCSEFCSSQDYKIYKNRYITHRTLLNFKDTTVSENLGAGN